MAWKYPKRPITGSYVIDIDPINQNFLAVAEESTGYLNEHNLKGPGLNLTTGEQQEVLAATDLMVTRTSGQLVDDIGFRLHRTMKTNANPSDDSLATPTGWTELRASDFYVTKAVEGLSMTRTFVGGMVWICASFNLHNHQAFDRGSTSVLGEKGFGYNLAIEVDGAIVPESLLGTGDVTQEFFGNEDFAAAGGGHINGNIQARPRGGGGVNGARNAIVLDAVMYLAPGEHTIRVAVQSIRNSALGFGSGYTSKTYISTAELFALEMLR